MEVDGLVAVMLGRLAFLITVVSYAPVLRAQAACDTVRAAAARDSLSPTAQAPAGRAAVVIYAAASAREVRFNAQPDIRVRLCGGLDSVRVLDRRNLTTPVVVGRTYRDVYVAVEIFGRVNADCIRRGADCASLDIRGLAPAPPPSVSNTARPPQDRSP